MQNLLTGHLLNAQPTERRTRSPKHPFYLDVMPFQIHPFCCAPVLAGETLSNSWMEAREVSKPIKNSIMGWSLEYYLFYVKLRDLNTRQSWVNMLLDPTAAVTDAMDSAANAQLYHLGSRPSVMQQCLERVVETYFRDEGEAWNNITIGGLPAAQIRDQFWMDSLVDSTAISQGAAPPNTNIGDMDRMLTAYEYLRDMQLTDMSFEQYIATFGVKLTTAELNKPELVSYVRDWTYPTNTVDPATGVPSAAISAVFKQSLNKKAIFCKEPGFLFGVHVVRPKVYFSRQFGQAVDQLDHGLAWLPAILSEQPETSLRQFTGGSSGNGPLSNGTTGPTNSYWADLRDLYLYGDQFVTTLADSDCNKVALPTAALQRKYPALADVQALFSGTTDATRKLNVDGVISFSIKGTQQDFTGSHAAIA